MSLRRRALGQGAVLLGYLALALAYSRPLPSRFSTHYPGTPSEAVFTVWNFWHFRHALDAVRDNPLWTDMQYWPYGANLLLIHYTLVNDAAIYLLGPLIGDPAAYNLLFLLSLVLSGWGVYLLLSDWKVPAAASFVAGAAYAFSPVLSLQVMTGRGMDYSTLYTLPFFAWLLFRAMRDGRLRDAVGAGAFLSLTFFYNYYYFLSALLLVPVAYASLHRPVRLSFARRPDGPGLRAARGACLAAAAAAGVLSFRAVLSGQARWQGSGTVPEILLSISPYLAFWALLGSFLLLRWRPVPSLDRSGLARKAWLPAAGVLLSWLAFNWPLIAALVYLMWSGDYGAPPNRWRGGGDPMDAAWLVRPNYFQPFWRDAFHRAFGPPYHASIGLVPIAAVLWLWSRRPRDEWARVWGACLAFFALLMLGPWLKLLGVHLYLPLPFYLLHALPVFINMPNGVVFNAMAALMAALLLGLALREAGARVKAAWGRALPWLALAVMAFEFWPGRLPTFRPEFPALIHRLAQRPDGAMLHIPVAVNFHILLNPGPLGDAFMNHELAQTIHGKPFVGGFLARVARRVHGYMSADPVFMGLLSAQEGGAVPPLLRDRTVMARYLRDNRLRYLLVEASRLPPELLRVVEGWPARLVDEEGTLRLYEVSGGLRGGNLIESRLSHGRS